MMGKPGFENDERHTLYLEYLRVIADHRPPIFVMENVKGLLSATIKGKSAIQKIVNDLSEPARAISNVSSDLTYNLYSLSEEEIAEGEIDPRMFIVRAEEYGVPQARHRMFIVGIRGDIKVRPRTLKKIAAPTVREMIGSLPAIRSGITKEKDSFENWKEAVHGIAKLNIHRQLKGTPFADSVSSKLSKDALGEMKHPQTRSSTRYSSNVPKLQLLQRLYDGRLKVLTSHEARGHKRSDLQRYLFISTFANETGRSPRLVDFPKVLLPEHKNVELGRKGEMFADRFKVQLPNSVSNTITSHISKDGHYFIHYDPAQCRSLTVREAARLQTFPDNYCFLGERTSQFHQVGNAVPPQLAKQIAVIVAEVLEAMPRR